VNSPCLLDTGFALCALAEPERIPAGLRDTADKHPLFLSVISYWEVVLKSMKGKLDVGDPRSWWIDALDKLGATSLPLRPAHIAAVQDLKPIHQDPFDRVLIAQASIENMVFATLDSEIPKYASERFRLLS
jgi:PIN domain nuclease of toxin-antitoxin system